MAVLSQNFILIIRPILIKTYEEAFAVSPSKNAALASGSFNRSSSYKNKSALQITRF